MLTAARRSKTICIVILIVMQFVFICNAQHHRDYIVDKQLFSDTVNVDEYKFNKSNNFYDTLQQKNYKSWVSRTLARLLIAGRSEDDVTVPSDELQISQDNFEPYDDKTITDIRIIQFNVFEYTDVSSERWINRFVNSLHVLTSEKQLQQNLLFKVGDKVDPYKLAINERLIRNLPYISMSYFLITKDSTNPNGVIVNIFARDSWTISGDLDLSSTPWVKLYDKNFIGTGNELSLKYYARYGHQHQGFETNYSIDNLWGTFTNVSLTFGVGATNNKAKIKATRPFIMPSDHIFGMIAGYEQENQQLSTLDTSMLINRLDYALWYGYSFNLNRKKGTNVFATIGGDMAFFHKRPLVTYGLNPYYHNRKTILLSLGVAQQNFFQGNMIYGFGKIEDIPYGFKVDATLGVQWSEYYNRRYYAAMSASWGLMTGAGYFNLMAGVSTFMYDINRTTQGQADVSLRYFSPLIKIGNNRFRQFVNVSSMWGFNRHIGEREMLSYYDYAAVRGVSTDVHSMGYDRFVVNSEMVWFTPLFFYHFRFAFNIWGDVGWLGYNGSIFRNPLSSAVGIGVRVKNERLIFNSISIRLGFAMRLPENARINPFQITNEQTLNIQGFEPTAPAMREYR